MRLRHTICSKVLVLVMVPLAIVEPLQAPPHFRSAQTAEVEVEYVCKIYAEEISLRTNLLKA